MPDRDRYQKNRHKIREEARLWYQKNREKRLASQRKWREENLELKRQIMKESARRRRAEHPEITRAIQRKCRENESPEQRAHRLARIAAWHKKHREELLEYWRDYNREDRDQETERIRSKNRKAWYRRAEGSFAAADIDRLCREQKGKCAICGLVFPVSGKHRFEVDHIVPLKPRGASVPRGTNWPDNLQLLCRTCNRSKANRLPNE